MKTTSRLTAAFILFFLATTSAQAVFYTVTLKNGTTFETRYRPIQADWDPNVSMFLTDQGNWIALPNEDIADVISVFAESGFGYQLDSSTRYVGWSPNDLVTDTVDKDGNVTEESQYDSEADDGGADYSIDQFLDIPVAGDYGNPTSVGSGGISIAGAGGDGDG